MQTLRTIIYTKYINDLGSSDMCLWQETMTLRSSRTWYKTFQYTYSLCLLEYLSVLMTCGADDVTTPRRRWSRARPGCRRRRRWALDAPRSRRRCPSHAAAAGCSVNTNMHTHAHVHEMIQSVSWSAWWWDKTGSWHVYMCIVWIVNYAIKCISA